MNGQGEQLRLSVGGTGLEQYPKTSGISSGTESGGAKRGAIAQDRRHNLESLARDPGFDELVQLWQSLNAAGRDELLKILRNLARSPRRPPR
jgi:hypothetical protein